MESVPRGLESSRGRMGRGAWAEDGGEGGGTAAEREGVGEEGSGQLCQQTRSQVSRDPKLQ